MQNAVLSLELPALPEHAATIRLFLSEAGRHFQVNQDSISDLKLAASEALVLAAGAPTGSGEPRSVSIGVRVLEGAMDIEIAAAGFDYRTQGNEESAEVADISLAIIQSLFPGALSEQKTDTIRFSVPIKP